MIRPVRCKKVACYPVGCDPVEAVSQYPIAEFKLGRCIIDYETGEEMDAVLPAVNGKSVERPDGSVFYVGADTARQNGEALLLSGEFENLFPYSEDFSQSEWIKVSGATVALVSDVEAPDGTAGVYRVDKGANDSRILETTVDAATGEHTASVFFRSPIGTGTIYIHILDSGFAEEVTVYPDRWTRFDITDTRTDALNRTFYLVDWREGGTLDSVYVWGAQLVQSKEKGPYIPTNGAPKTFASEAGSATNGISYDFDNNPMLKAMLGGLVQDAAGNVLTPVGDELINTVVTSNYGWSDTDGSTKIALGLDSIQFASPTAYQFVYKALLLAANTKYIISGNVSGLTTGQRLRITDFAVGAGPTIDEDGSFCVEYTTTTNRNFYVQALAAGINATITNISVKPVEAEGRIHWEGSFGFDKADVGTNINLLSANGYATSLLYINNLGQIRSADGAHYPFVNADWSAGTSLEIDIYYSYKTGKFHMECNGEVGTENDFVGWNLSLNRIVQAWGLLDGLSIEVGPKQTYIEGVA